MSSIISNTNPKIYDGVDTVELDYAVLLKEEPIIDDVEMRNPVSLLRVFDNKGYYLDVMYRIHLHRHNTPETYHDSIKALWKSDVNLWLDRDAGAIPDPDGNPADFYFAEFNEWYWQTHEWLDIVVLRFLSKTYVNIFDPTVVTFDTHVRITEDGDTRITEDGDTRILQ